MSSVKNCGEINERKFMDVLMKKTNVFLIPFFFFDFLFFQVYFKFGFTIVLNCMKALIAKEFYTSGKFASTHSILDFLPW